MSAIQAAFEKAGYKPATDRLSEIARDICTKTTAWDAQRDLLLDKVKNDSALLWALFDPFKNQAVQLLLSKMNQELRVERQKAVVANAPKEMPGVQVGFENHGGDDTRRTDGGGHTPRADPPATAPSKPNAAALQASAALKSQIIKRSMLDTLVNGRKVGDLSVREARDWHESFGAKAHFVRLLTQNLPERGVIRDYRTDADAQDLWHKAQKEWEGSQQ